MSIELSLINKIKSLLVICEAEPDFWPASRRFVSVAEYELAFEGLYLYLLERQDIWKQNHALIKAIKGALEDKLDFDELEFTTLDESRYCDRKAVLDWRASIVKEFGN